MIRTECPKCFSNNAYYQTTEVDMILRCLCGYHKVVQTTLESFEVTYSDTESRVKLPRRGSHMWNTLLCLANLERATSGEVTRRLIDLGHGFSVSDVSSYLTILRTKGLVLAVEIRKGIPGGSTWILSDTCGKMLNI